MQSRFITVDGYRLHLLEGGAGPAALLLHGFAGSAEDWRPTADLLAGAGYRVIAADLLGFGRSAKPANAPYSLELGARLLAGLLDTLGVSRAALVAHSMGGKYAMALALLHPARVGRLALVATDGFVPGSPFTKAGGWPLVGAGMLWAASRPAVVRAMLGSAFYAPAEHLSAGFVERGRQALSGPDNRRALSAISRRYDATDMRHTGLRERLAELRAPTLLVWGEHDQVFSLSVARVAAAELPAAQLVTVPRCGHYPQIEAARVFGGLLLGFLAGGSAL